MALFKNKYRVESARLPEWDYGNDSAYFITICIKAREHLFGKITEGDLILNEIGMIAQDEWLKTPAIRPDMNLQLDEFVVMPNHFHAILFIGENQFNMPGNGTQNIAPVLEGFQNKRTQIKFGPQSKNLSSIIRGFKSAVTKRAKETNEHFAWQERFHDHIIRNYESYQRIRDYIVNNPANWESDKFHSK